MRADVKRIGLLLVGAFALLTSGCSSDGNTNSITSTTSSNGTVFDPYAPAEGSGVTVSDARGSWQQIKLDPTNPVFNNKMTNIVTKDANGKPVSTNLTDADIYAARNWVVDFVATQALDSIAWDSTSGWKTWMKTEGPKYIEPGHLSELLTKPSYIKKSESGETIDRSLIIMNNPNNQFTDGLLRNGSTRISSFGFNSGLNANLVSANKDAIAISGTVMANYSVDEKAVILMAQSQGSKLADIRSLHPNLFDGKPETGHLTFDFSYTVSKQRGGSWKIVGYKNNFSFAMNGN